MESLFWVDQIARQVKDRETKLARGLPKLRTEMGIGASGIPHIGSTGDGVRSYVVHKTLEQLGEQSEFIAFTDDLDGLRKVPTGFPAALSEHIGKPVSTIPDPEGSCHQSFGHHMTALLQDAFEQLGIRFTLKRASEEYKNGTLDKAIITLLTHAPHVGTIIKKLTGQTKYQQQLPYMPICATCGNVNTTVATAFDPVTNQITYTCSGTFIGKDAAGTEIVKQGCGHSGTCGIRDGKLVWKSDFAARWQSLGITYEAYGKDIAESVAVNDALCKKILHFEPPVHSFYELFTERSGMKISKSRGNVFTPQLWLQYGSPESLRLLFLKKLAKTRVVDPLVIPAYMNELDDLAAVYFDKQKVANEKERAHLKRLYEFAHFLEPPSSYPVNVPFRILINLARIIQDEDAVVSIAAKLADIPIPDTVRDVAAKAVAWIHDVDDTKQEQHSLTKEQKAVLTDLITLLERSTPDATMFSELANKHGMETKEFYGLVYQALLGAPRGPRLTTLIEALGVKRAITLLKNALSSS
ncbi:MAG: lysine--tRNA ligase [Nanoarchaeota archaeon]|nr:lysine--tRNA ligase [Nanoarchaeota archaeon]